MKFLIDILQAITLVIFSILSLPFLCIMTLLGKISDKISIKNNKLFQSPIVNTKIKLTTDSHIFERPIYGVGPVYDEIFEECKRKATVPVTYHNEILDSESIFLTIVQRIDAMNDDSAIIISSDMIKHVEFMIDKSLDWNTLVEKSKFNNHRFLGFKKGTNIEIYSVPQNILSGNKMLIGTTVREFQFDCVIEKYEYKAGTYYFDRNLPNNIGNEYACLEFTDKGHTINDIINDISFF